MDQDLKKSSELLECIQSNTAEVIKQVNSMIQTAKKQSTTKGISFLDVKHQMLLSYLINLTHILLKKTSGQSIVDDKAIDRMVEIRTVLEKMRPIDKKLKYQIDKVIKTAVTGASESSNPLRYKANPDNLVSKLDDGGSDSGSDDDNSDEDNKNKTKIYVPPKLAPAHFDGDEKDKQEKAIENAKKRALSSSMIRELRQEYQEGPDEIRESRDLHRFKEDKKAKEREEYEEEHFVRLSVSKKEKNASKRMGTMSSLNSITQFDDITALMEGGLSQQGVSASKKRKIGSKGKKGKKGFKKRKKKF